MRRVTIGSVLIAGVGLAAWLLVTQGPRGGPQAPPPGDTTIGFTEVQPKRGS